MKALLHGLGVWLTRPEPNLTQSAAVWSAQGAEVLCAPTVEIRPCPPTAEEKRACDELLSRHRDPVVALPSRRAAENFVAALGTESPLGSPWRAAAVGEATARVAEELGLKVVLRAPKALGRTLAASILQRLDPHAVLLPSSDRRRPELGDGLRTAGVEVVDLTVHHTVPTEELDPALWTAVGAGGIGLVVAYSPSALAFVEVLDEERRRQVAALPFACLGPTTAASARRRGLDVVVEPRDPGEQGLVEAAVTWYAGG